MDYGLIGEKLSHSFSKQIHESIGLYSYDLCPLRKEEFSEFMERKEFRGINVTIPYKKAVLPYLSWIDETARQIGAVNTIVNQNGRLLGYNTDYFGLLYTAKRNHLPIQNNKVLVLGNGGAAAAVFAMLHKLSAGEIITVKYKKEPGVFTYEETAALHSDASLLINTSPVGMFPSTDCSPVDLTPYHSLCAVFDLIFNPLQTKLLKQAKELGMLAVNGLEMLVAQAKYAAEYFTGTELSDSMIEPILQELLVELKKHPIET